MCVTSANEECAGDKPRFGLQQKANPALGVDVPAPEYWLKYMPLSEASSSVRS